MIYKHVHQIYNTSHTLCWFSYSVDIGLWTKLTVQQYVCFSVLNITSLSHHPLNIIHPIHSYLPSPHTSPSKLLDRNFVILPSSKILGSSLILTLSAFLTFILINAYTYFFKFIFIYLAALGLSCIARRIFTASCGIFHCSSWTL